MNERWDVNETMIEKYLRACSDFVRDNELFNNFKQDSRYTAVLEHVSKEESELYISEMKLRTIVTDDVLESVKENDKYGSPTLVDYEQFGKVSPSTIRYLKNSLDIVNQFGQDFSGGNILEIGGGYGGLCKVLSSFVEFDNYYLVDLPEASRFSKKYLDHFDSIKNKITYMNTDNISPVDNLDLVISNYAFSECTRKFQKIYYDSFIKNAKRFYMVYNNFTENNIDVGEFVDMACSDFIVTIQAEDRTTHKNYILYGTKIQ